MFSKFGGLFMIVVMALLGLACLGAGKVVPAAVCAGVAAMVYVFYFGGGS